MKKRDTPIALVLLTLAFLFLISLLNQNQLFPLGPGCGGDGDFNENGEVNYLDLELLAQAYGTNDPSFDLDCSGVVDYPDIELMRPSFQKTYDLNQDGEINNIDVIFIEGLFDKRLWSDSEYEPIADLFLDGINDPMDYLVLIDEINSEELENPIHKNQLMGTSIRKKIVAEMSLPLRHVTDTLIFWSTSFLKKSGQSGFGSLSVEEAYETFDALTENSLKFRYLSSTTDWEDAEIPYTLWYDYSHIEQMDSQAQSIEEQWFVYHDSPGIANCGSSPPIPYE